MCLGVNGYGGGRTPPGTYTHPYRYRRTPFQGLMVSQDYLRGMTGDLRHAREEG